MTKNLKRKLIIALMSVLCTLIVAVSVTYAWYVFNTSGKTTDVHMAAGSTMSLSISNSYDGTYGLSTPLTGFTEYLNPVSTNSIQGGFQKVAGFTDGSDVRSKLANIFAKADSVDYFSTSLYIKSSEDNTRLFLQNVGYEDSDTLYPMSTAIRVGLLVHEPGQDMPIANEYIFEINKDTHADAYYNTYSGVSGYVLDSSKTDGTTVPFTPYSPDNYCGKYDTSTGKITLKDDTIQLSTLVEKNVPIEIEVYIWLEGCDPECTEGVVRKGIDESYIKNLTLSFAGDLG